MASNNAGEGFWESLPFAAKVALVTGVTGISVGVVATCIYKLQKPSGKASSKPPAPQPVTAPKTEPSDSPRPEPQGPVQPPSKEPEKKEVEVAVEKEKTPLEAAEDWRIRGNKWFRADRFDKALEYYREALSICPEEFPKERAIYYQNIAAAQERCALNEKDQGKKLEYQIEVIRSCCEAIKLHREYPKPYARRGRAYATLGQHSKALHDYITISILDDTIMKMVAADFETSLREVAKTKAEEIEANRADILPANISYTNAMGFLNMASRLRFLSRSGVQAIWSDCLGKVKQEGERDEDGEGEREEEEKELTCPEDQPLMVAVTAFEQRDYETTVTTLDTAVASGEQCLRPYARLALAALMVMMHRRKETLEQLAHLEGRPDLPTEVLLYMHILRGEVHIENGDDKEAVEAYSRAVEVDPEHPDGYLFRGKAYFTEGEGNNPMSALEDMKKASSLNGDDPIVMSNYAYALFKFGAATNSMMQVEKAVEMFKSGIQRFPESALIHATYGHMLQEAMQIQIAHENFEKAATLDPLNALHHVSLCFSKVFMGNSLSDAIPHAEKAITVDPFCGLGYQALASLELQRLNVDKSMELYEKACQLTRSKTELTSCVAAFEMSRTQVEICDELDMKLEDVLKSAEKKLKQSMTAPA